MSHFYGTLQGGRGRATRCGTKKSGLDTRAASWGGCISVNLYHNEKTGEDTFLISQDRWHGHGIDETIASGIIGQPTKKEPPRPGMIGELTAALKTLVSGIEDMAILDDSEKWESILQTAKNAIKKAEG